ncbi:MAG: NYN domain-containing protein [Acidimicrobiales bacterium]
MVDGNNVVGAAADGWWRDPPAAVRRLLERLHCYARSSGEDVVLVLDVPQPDLAEGDDGHGVEVRYATRAGRNAADDRIRELTQRGDVVVTSDRALADDVKAAGAAVLGSGAFLSRLQQTGC